MPKVVSSTCLIKGTWGAMRLSPGIDSINSSGLKILPAVSIRPSRVKQKTGLTSIAAFVDIIPNQAQ